VPISNPRSWKVYLSADVAMYLCTCIVGGLVPIITAFIPDRVSVSDDRQPVAELGG
jgi:hypothetical protein